MFQSLQVPSTTSRQIRSRKPFGLLVTLLTLIVPTFCFSAGCSNDKKATFDNSCETNQDCAPGQVCSQKECTDLEEGELLGSFECIRDDPEPNAGKSDIVAKLGGKNYSISAATGCATDALDDFFYSITAFGISDGSGSGDWVTIFQDDITGFAGEPKQLSLAKSSTSEFDTGYMSSMVDGTRVIVGWIESGSITIDQYPPASGTTITGTINAKLKAATQGKLLSAACNVVSDCGNDTSERCSPILNEDEPRFCWSECDHDPTVCGANGACIGYTTALGTPRQFCVAACVNDGCVNTALTCRTSTNGVKGCYQ